MDGGTAMKLNLDNMAARDAAILSSGKDSLTAMLGTGGGGIILSGIEDEKSDTSQGTSRCLRITPRP